MLKNVVSKQFKSQENLEVKEYPELEGTHKNHRVQFFIPHRANQKLNHITECCPDAS